MHTKDDKAYATLTDVKNKTGDVFALADQFGEVTITSYNKDKYAIRRLVIAKISITPEQNELAETTMETDAAPQLEASAEANTLPQPEATTQLEVPAALDTLAILEITPVTEELVPANAPMPEPVPDPVPEIPPVPEISIIGTSGQIEQVMNANKDIVGVFAGIGFDSLWDRGRRSELEWVKDTHKLL